MSGKIARYYHTIKYLRPVQIIGQLSKPIRSSAKVPTTAPLPPRVSRYTLLIPALDLSEAYLSRFDVDRLMRNELTLLHEAHPLDLSTWKINASPLWRFNLHYFEFAIALAAQYRKTADEMYYEKFVELLRSWMVANPAGTGDAWHPYTISMRLPNLLICLDLFGDTFESNTAFRESVYKSIYTQYRALIKRKETWQLGNHYLENLKAILLGSLLFEEQAVFKKHIRLFLREIKEEILPDGVHFERSPMYHKIILEDVIRVAYWLQQSEKPQYKQLLPVLRQMVSALASLEKGMGKTPLFNDSGDGVAKEWEALAGAAKGLFGIVPAFTDEFPNSGYYKLYDGNLALMFDAGEIGPRYMAGHGHCDCLSFELSMDGKPLLVNAGTYQYQGDKRKYFRSTKAHNTLMIGEREQSECWGEHRVARRIRHVYAHKNGQTLIGSYRTYLGDTHSRMISLVDRTLRVLDTTHTKTPTTVHSYLHLANELVAKADDADISILLDGHTLCRIRPVEANYFIHTTGSLTDYAPGFGILRHGNCIEFRWQADDKQHGYAIQIY